MIASCSSHSQTAPGHCLKISTGLANRDVVWINTAGARLGTQRIGDALRDAQRALKRDGGDYRDVTIGTVLLGDPALRVR